ncbi:hypothetical protein [Flavobacterium sp. 245]|uniref:hypothetical protein n=1 Tax=Flavobacterium sp. 245 TaxID=2512115 RepID=UPI00105F9B08|nr:hypothetical protein [Flavobacterium sp. 245]TDO94938.1 hypothetical protein EV145_11524 [Flavobacterium sp. 245]
MKKNYLFLLLFFWGTIAVTHAQDSQELVLKFDLATQSLLQKGIIPFDKKFDLVLEKMPKTKIKYIHAYQTVYKNGERLYKINKFKDCPDSTGTVKYTSVAVKDLDLKFTQKGDTLRIKFDPLKPNVEFAVHIVTELDPNTKKMLMQLNTALSKNEKGTKEYGAIDKVTTFRDGDVVLTYFNIGLDGYKKLYDDNFKDAYDSMANSNVFKTTALISEVNIQAYDGATSKNVTDSTGGYLLLETARKKQFNDILLGRRDINNALADSEKSIADDRSPEKRIINLKNNIKYFDEVQRKLTGVISKGITWYKIENKRIDLNLVKEQVEQLRAELQFNFDLINSALKKIDATISKAKDMGQVVYFSSNTQALDLKTAGGNILFLDLGFTSIFATDLNNEIAHIPKLFVGFSIYFRPIDSNTRRGKFKDYKDAKNMGCIVNNNSLSEYGPDYGIASRWNIWQRLSLSVGITLGSMDNKDFDNYYSGNSLVLGPAYRFARAFKVSSGVALLKRSSTNPLISEKHVVAGAYVSLSVDIDVISKISDVTKMIFK